jgi:hypothetical protein
MSFLEDKFLLVVIIQEYRIILTGQRKLSLYSTLWQTCGSWIFPLINVSLGGVVLSAPIIDSKVMYKD